MRCAFYSEHLGISLEDDLVWGGEVERHMAGDETTNWKAIIVILAEYGECLKQKRKRGSGKIKHTQGEKIMRFCEI